MGAYELRGVHLFGNVLWYDGSTASVPNQALLDFAGGAWPDHCIKGFEPLTETRASQAQILNHLPKPGQTGLLLTHCVPHRALNAHLQRPNTAGKAFNAFSGLAAFLEQVPCAYAVSGHTHLPVAETLINGCRCWNVGNDFYPPIRHVLLEVA